MKKSEMATLLHFKHSIEGGEVTESEVEAWHAVIGDVEFSSAMGVVREHYRDAALDDRGVAPRLMPRHVVEGAVEPLRSASWVGNVTEQRLAGERAAVTA